VLYAFDPLSNRKNLISIALAELMVGREHEDRLIAIAKMRGGFMAEEEG
jgi:hypothetical protein